MALRDMFLKIDGTKQGPIKGESVDTRHAGEIDVVSWSWGMSSPSDAFGNAKVAVAWQGIQTHCGVCDRTQHLLACGGLGAAVIQKKSAMDAGRPITIREPRQRDQPRPATLGLEVCKVGMEHQIRRGRIQ